MYLDIPRSHASVGFKYCQWQLRGCGHVRPNSSARSYRSNSTCITVLNGVTKNSFLSLPSSLIFILLTYLTNSDTSAFVIRSMNPNSLNLFKHADGFVGTGNWGPGLSMHQIGHFLLTFVSGRSVTTGPIRSLVFSSVFFLSGCNSNIFRLSSSPGSGRAAAANTTCRFILFCIVSGHVRT